MWREVIAQTNKQLAGATIGTVTVTFSTALNENGDRTKGASRVRCCTAWGRPRAQLKGRDPGTPPPSSRTSGSLEDTPSRQGINVGELFELANRSLRHEPSRPVGRPTVRTDLAKLSQGPLSALSRARKWSTSEGISSADRHRERGIEEEVKGKRKEVIKLPLFERDVEIWHLIRTYLTWKILLQNKVIESI